VREIRGSYNECVIGCIPSFCWITKMKDLEISLVDVAHTRVNHVYMCLYCIVYLLCFIFSFILFYFFAILFF
jgi:hypothetical protein